MRQPQQGPLFDLGLPRLESKKFTLIPKPELVTWMNGRRYVFYIITFHPGEDMSEVHAGFRPVSDWTMKQFKTRCPVLKGFPRIFTFGKGRNRRLNYIVFTSSGWTGGQVYFSQREVQPTDLFLIYDTRPQPNARR
ncbi:MAG: hypothetical protein A2941_01095 [Candidatus Yanofskybacteria bacterium RIFCSPLOWO2_01_FULL_49_17]|uniref:Uncharacterized protein n=1 Tax=Candidatus Yanofskybacteria bacterium RIFCSPLOWO2_01_FULL_49_17 TaxID=1802700 RepID=A0A1F8GPQ6_9BACT|nr:MAG: hypothetical protein A2941_01095 [Candidatus Yanofskybacteria bacterium RIFCSPLOWO2_01_FULL_49_17]